MLLKNFKRSKLQLSIILILQLLMIPMNTEADCQGPFKGSLTSQPLTSQTTVSQPVVCQPSNCEANDLNACHDDWVIDPTNTLCGGLYVEPTPPYPEQTETVLPNQPVIVNADRSLLSPEGISTLHGQVHLIQGNRQLFAEEAKIYQDKKTQKVERVSAEDNIKILEPGLRLTGTQGELLVPEDKQKICNAEYRLYEKHARGCARSIEANGKDYMVLRKATYTTCAPRQNTWHLRAKKVVLNKETGRGQATHARLYVKDIPIFYVPYLDFPIDDRRKTGFLFPEFESTSTRGLELGFPFYWNMAPNYDATITPRYLSKRGVDFQGQYRFITRRSIGEVQASVLPNDKAYKAFKKRYLSEPLKYPGNDPRIIGLRKGGDTRSSIFLKDTTRIHPRLVLRGQYHRVSDDNYFMDLGNTLNITSTTNLLQFGDLAYNDLYWSGLLRVQNFQTLHPFFGPITIEPYRILPKIAIQNMTPDLPYGFVWTTESDFTHFTHKFGHHKFEPNAKTFGDRFQLRPGIALPIVHPGWFIKPRLQWNLLGYSLHLNHRDRHKLHWHQSPFVHMPMFDLDTGLIFERPIHFFNCNYIQTLEPRAYYLWVPFRNQNKLPNFDSGYSGFDFNQLFRYNRFNGLDRVGDANQVTLALSTKMMNDRTGAERASFTFGQIFYFRDRKVTVCDSATDPSCRLREYQQTKRICGKKPCTASNLASHCDPASNCNSTTICNSTSNKKCCKHRSFHTRRRSNYVGMARYHLDECWTLNAIAQLNPYSYKWDEGLTWLQYQPNEFTVFNFGYLYLRYNPVQLDPTTSLPTTLNQSDISAALAITDNWRVLARHQYDLRFKRTNEILMGIEYQGCCTALRLTVARYIMPNDFVSGRRKYQNGFFIQFIFKGFAGVGPNTLNRSLERSIPGYQFRRDRY